MATNNGVEMTEVWRRRGDRKSKGTDTSGRKHQNGTEECHRSCASGELEMLHPVNKPHRRTYSHELAYNRFIMNEIHPMVICGDAMGSKKRN